MKKLFCLTLILFMVLSSAYTMDEAEKAEFSYAFGILIGLDLMEMGIEFDYDAFILGFRQAMEDEETRYTINEAVEIIGAIMDQRQTQIAEYNLGVGEAFLAENMARPEVTVTASGLQYEVVFEGSGERPNIADSVLVHYIGTTLEGEIFDSTYEFGEPVEIPLFRVIPGWSEGLRLMREGERAMLYIPPDLAYGSNGAGGLIGPNAVLIFDVELLSIIPSQIILDEGE